MWQPRDFFYSLNAGPEPRLEAGAQRTLEDVGSNRP